MSGGDKKKDFVDTTFRKKWDSEYYAQRAKDREAGILVDDDDDNDGNPNDRKKLKNNKIDPDKPLEFFKARDEDLQLSSKIGKSSIISGVTPTEKQGGFYCDVCDLQFKDSTSMLNHVNTKRHNRLKGVSMRVETSSLSQVKNKLKKGKEDKLKSKLGSGSVNKLSEKELQLQRDQEYEKVVKNIKEKEEKEGKILTVESNDKDKEEVVEKEKEKEKEKEEKTKVEYEEDEFDYSSFGLPTNFGSSKKSK